ncbi:MAG: ABC transporter permease [Eubacterium sp.]|nr:ABC transporter permease [Eubacterium sp.]
MELKRMRRHLLSMIAGTVLVIGLISVILFLVANNERQGRISRTRVGLVMGENGAFSGFVTQAMNSLGEIGEAFSFEEMSEDEGSELLEQGEITTLLIVPDDYVRSLFYGENKPVTIRYASSHADIPSLLLKQLTSAAASYIIDTEAGMYSVNDWYRKEGKPLTDETEYALNLDYLNAVMNRNASIREELIDTYDSASYTQYYVAAGIALWLLMIGLSCRDMLAPETGSLYTMIAVRGVSFLAQSALRGISFLLTYGMYYLMFAIPASVIACVFYEIPWYVFVSMIPAVWLTASVVRLVYTVVTGRIYSIVLLLLLLLIMGFISGYFYPSQYLPESLQNVGACLPTSFIFKSVRESIVGNYAPVTSVICVLYSVILDAISVAIDLGYRVRRLR